MTKTPRNLALLAVIGECERRGIPVAMELEYEGGTVVGERLVLVMGYASPGDLKALERTYRRALRRAGGDPVARPLGAYAPDHDTAEAVAELVRREMTN